LRRRAARLAPKGLHGQTLVESLMERLECVTHAHEQFLERQLERNHVETRQGRARFLSEHEIEIANATGAKHVVRADYVVIATGSRPRTPPDIAIDHDRVLDSDSILSMIYLPESLVILGAGVIACEFATIFQSLGVRVTMVDRGERPLAFLDAEIVDLFVRSFEESGGRFIGGRSHARVANDGFAGVDVELLGGESLRAERVLVALGRTASVGGLNLAAAGLAVNERGFIAVDAHCRTNVPHIYAAGDVIGPPALATASMDQGRRAVRHALGLDLGAPASSLPTGIYTIPEIATVGLSASECAQRHGGAIVGRARFDEIARGQINGETDGLLKLVCDPAGAGSSARRSSATARPSSCTSRRWRSSPASMPTRSSTTSSTSRRWPRPIAWPRSTSRGNACACEP
jgi:NAD(P) transhydrogenase